MAGKERGRERAEGERPPVSLQFAATLVHARTSECDLAAGEGGEAKGQTTTTTTMHTLFGGGGGGRKKMITICSSSSSLSFGTPVESSPTTPIPLPRSRGHRAFEQELKC